MTCSSILITVDSWVLASPHHICRLTKASPASLGSGYIRAGAEARESIAFEGFQNLSWA